MSLSNHQRDADPLLERRLAEALDAARRKGAELDALRSRLADGPSRKAVAAALAELERRGEAVEWNRRWYALRHTDWVVGRVELLRGGRGLLLTGENDEAGFFLQRSDLNGARDGDLVLAKPRRRRGRRQRGKLPEASVSKILERRWTRLVGRALPWHSGYRLEPFDPRLKIAVDLQGGIGEAEPGDYVVVELLETPGRRGLPAGRVTEVLGDADAPGVDVEIILRHFEIPDSFPAAVEQEAAAFGEDPAPADFENRLDLRDATLVTIDGASARDFDDAISVEAAEGAGYRLGVHIADVSHYVGEGSALDREARRRGTSVYFPDRAVPMLPEGLSNGLCSLRPDVPRLTVSALLDVDASGRVRKRSFALSVVRSRRRMTYGEVRRLLEEPRPEDAAEYGEVLPMLQRAEALRRELYARRIDEGSLDLDLPEVRLALDAEGRVESIGPTERTVAHRLIEELMIAANRAVAAELDGAEVPCLHRLHAPPDAGTLEDLRAGLAAVGIAFPSSLEALDSAAFQAVLAAAEGSPKEALVSSLVLRSMQRAVYSAADGGHFALAARHYTHFTSPIRRYPDLLVHRQLKRHLEGESTPESLLAELPTIASSSSRTERRAERAERELVKWKKVRYLADRVDETFTGTITGVTPFGLFVQLDEYLVDGLIAIRTLTDDYYHFEPERSRLIGESQGRIFRLGDEVEVLLVAVDEASRNLDFEIPDMPPPRRESRRRERRSVY